MTTPAIKVAIVFHSGYGHTTVVAQALADGVREAGAEPVLLQIQSAGDDFKPILEAAGAADAIVFGAPTYMGDVSAALKAFFEASSGAWYASAWKDKVAGGFTNSFNASGDKLHALMSIFVLSQQQHMIWVGAGQPASSHGTPAPTFGADEVNRFSYSIGVATQSDNAGPDVTPGSGDREFARRYGARIATITRQLKG
jgi:NAD(P)H dehydrogenase (quinone)